MVMPGPIVDDIVTLSSALPFAADGGLDHAVDQGVGVVDQTLRRERNLAHRGVDDARSCRRRNSTLPALISRTALAMSIVTVPVFGFGISAAGPRTLPSLPTRASCPGVATAASKSIEAALDLLDHLFAADVRPRPASVASAACRRRRWRATFLLLPSPCGRTTVPRTI